MEILKVSNLNVYYGNAQALRDISIDVFENEIVTLVGGNGAGKTTLMMTISGIIKARSGSVEFMGRRVDGLKPYQIVRLGIAQVSQERNLFPNMTVMENLELGAYPSQKTVNIKEKLEEVYQYFEVLDTYKEKKASLLSGGEQQMLAVGRALMSNVRLLLLDEPSTGLAPIIVKELSNIIRRLRDEAKLTTLLVEQNATLALDLAERGYVLEVGSIIATGTTSNLRKSDLVKKAYLGL
jgi:branched-chain amino acid transport system ATP-binding protein